MMEAGATKTMMAVDHNMEKMEAGDIRILMVAVHSMILTIMARIMTLTMMMTIIAHMIAMIVHRTLLQA